MTNRIPLIVNPEQSQIQELGTGDNLVLPAGSNIELTGNIKPGAILTDGYYYANGQPFSGGGGNVDLLHVTTDIIPQGNVTQSLGNSTNQWSSLWVAGNTIYMDNVPVSLVDGNLQVDGDNVIVASPQGDITTTGNVSGAYILGDGSQLTNLPVQPGTYGDANVAAYLASGTDNSNIVTTGNIQGSYILGNGSQLTGLPAGYSNAEVATYLASGNISTNIITTANVTANSFITGNLTIQSNVITSNGDIITIDPYGNGVQGNVIIQGNLDVRGTTTTINSNVVSINDLVFNVANNAATASEANGGGFAVGPVDAEYATLLYSSTTNSWNSNLPLNVTGAVTADYLAGDGSNITNITGANVTGQVANAQVAGTVYSNAQPNITSVGTLTSLAVTGNITANNVTTVTDVTAQGNVNATYFIGDGSKLAGIAPTVQVYAFSNTISTGGYYEATWLAEYVAGPITTVTTTVTTTPTLMGGFITELGYPNISVIPTGTILTRIETEKTGGTAGYYIYAEIYKRNTEGVETLIATSDQSSVITQNNIVQQNLLAYITVPVELATTDRIVSKIYGVMESGADRDINMSFDNNTGAGVQLPALPASAANFVPYTGATSNVNLGNNSITTTGNVVTGNILTDGYLYANGTPVSFGGDYGNANVAAYLPTISNDGNVVVYVDPVYGNDSYSGTALGPKQTISNAIATLGGQTGVVYLAPGTYTEDWTYSGNTSVSFDGSGYGSQVNLTGNVVFAHTDGSCDLTGVNVANLTYSGPAGSELYLFQSYYQNLTHTSAGQLSMETCTQQGTGNLLAAGGNITINTSTVGNMIVSNTSAFVQVYNSRGAPVGNAGWQHQAGTLGITNSSFFIPIGANAITVSSGAAPIPGVAPVLSITNTSIIDLDGSAGNINIGTNAFWAVSGVSFDSTNSVITSPYNIDTVWKYDSALFYRNITVGTVNNVTGNIRYTGSLLGTGTGNNVFSGPVSVPTLNASTSITAPTVTISTLANITGTTAATSTTTGSLKTAGGLGVAGNVYAANVYSTGAITSSSKTVARGVGYATGAGNVVTQTTSRSTSVALTGYSGQITTTADTLAASTGVTFTVVNPVVAAADIVAVNHVSGGTFGNYFIQARVANAGNVTVQVYNATAGSLSDALVIGFAVIKGATA